MAKTRDCFASLAMRQNNEARSSIIVILIGLTHHEHNATVLAVKGNTETAALQILLGKS